MSARTTGRVIIPKSPADLLGLAKKIYEKHQAEGVNSPLNAMKDYSWADDGAKIEPCMEDHAAAEDFKRKAEAAYLRRDLNLAPLTKIVKNSAALLKSVYAKNPKVLGEWGIVVDDTVQVKRTPKP